MHDLTQEEFNELSTIQYSLIQALKKYLHSEREYIFCFAEAEGFKHIHFHVVPKHDGFDDAYKGAKVFHYIKPTEEEKLAEDRVKDICDELGELMK
jgi:diadenosine tetraphosphate (Ap4A) HIT family hydrolase